MLLELFFFAFLFSFFHVSFSLVLSILSFFCTCSVCFLLDRFFFFFTSLFCFVAVSYRVRRALVYVECFWWNVVCGMFSVDVSIWNASLRKLVRNITTGMVSGDGNMPQVKYTP